MLVVLGFGAVRLAGADPAVPLPTIVDPADPRAKISSLIRPYLDLPVAAQGIDHRLSRLMARSSRPELLKVRLDVPVTPATLADIAGTGALVVSTSARWNCVLVEATLAQIDALARLPEVSLIAAALRPRHHGVVGTYASQAAPVLHTDSVSSTYGVTGRGQIIGVISDSVNQTPATGATLTRTGGTVAGSNPGTLTGLVQQGQGDLPAAIAVFNLDLYNFQPSSNPALNFTDTDEGEALLEAAYHIAPGAGYAFSSCGEVQTDFATSIGQLQGYGCTLMCDDIGFPDEPMFQDGPIAQATATFVAAGGIYCSAAGNDAQNGILLTYVPATGSPDPHTNGNPNGYTFANWGINGGTPSFLELEVGPQVNLQVVLEWNQPYHSYRLGAGASTDLNLYLYDNTSVHANLLAASTDLQQGDVDGVGLAGDPYEVLNYFNSSTTSNATVYLAVDRFSGPATNVVMRVLTLTDGGYVSCVSTPNLLTASSIQGHPSALSVTCIAAVDWNQPTVPEPFTSFGGWNTGGMPFYFDTSGNLYNANGTPQLRNKPDLTGTDGLYVNNANFVFPGPGSNPDGFYGTSCAAPSVTAAAALAWCVQPGLTNSQIIAELTHSATDITASPASAGGDGWTGYGLVNALASIGSTITGVTKVTSTPSSGTLGGGTVTIQVTFLAAVTVSGTPVLELNTTPPRQATYSSGSGTTTLTFTYHILPGDVSSDLDVASITALSGGTITAALPVSLILPKPGSPSSLGVNSSLTIAAVPDALTVNATPATSNQTAFTFTFTFAEPVTGFTAGMITLVNGTPGAFTAVSGSTYTLAVTASALGGQPTETVTASVAAGVVNDIAGNPNLAASGSALVDTVPPTLAITLASASVITGQSDTATFTFSKAIIGFSAASVTVTGGSLGTLSGSGALYTMPVTAGAVGTLTVGVNTAGLHDAAGNTLATPISADATITAPPPGSSSKHCGFGNFFGLLLLGGLLWLRRGQAAARPR
jgi:hypothetical protein